MEGSSINTRNTLYSFVGRIDGAKYRAILVENLLNNKYEIGANFPLSVENRVKDTASATGVKPQNIH